MTFFFNQTMAALVLSAGLLTPESETGDRQASAPLEEQAAKRAIAGRKVRGAVAAQEPLRAPRERLQKAKDPATGESSGATSAPPSLERAEGSDQELVGAVEAGTNPKRLEAVERGASSGAAIQEKSAAADVKAPPRFQACRRLPAPMPGPLPFPVGEKLFFDVDVMGASAGDMEFAVLPRQGRGKSAEQPVRVRMRTNTFFSKVRKVQATVVSHMNAFSLRPTRFQEDLVQNDLLRVQKARFDAAKGEVDIRWQVRKSSGQRTVRAEGDLLDYVGAFFLFRALPLQVGDAFCFDAVAMRRLWRVEGVVEARESVSTPAGEFQALHLSGKAIRRDKPSDQRALHLWLSDDERRLPLAAMGVIDLGTVRAILSSVQRPDVQIQAARPSDLEW